MKSKKLSRVLLMVALALVVGCVPLYTMLIQGKWEVDEYYKNGKNETTGFYFLFADYVVNFHSDGYFTETYKLSQILPITNSGTWSFINNAQQLRLVDDSSTRTYDVKRLTKEEMRLYRDLGAGEYEELILDPKKEIQ